MNSKTQRWECIPCRRSVLVVFHTSDRQPTERQCKCGRAMGQVLFTSDTSAPVGSSLPETRTKAQA